ncbi:MAG: hypothetical protein IJ727_01775 [Treponema sp.]|nr:hypothetical protein [Treponema sp.]
MKKIISALTVATIAAGFAMADMKVTLNYRNGAELFKYVDKGLDGRSTDDYGNVYIDSGYDNNGSTTTLFNLNGWNAGKDNVGLQLSGDIFTVKSTLQPTVNGNSIIWHIFDIGAKYSRFYANAGWNGDGIMNYRAKKAADDGNEEGKVFETYKLGSIFTGSDGLCSTNQISFNTGRNFYALAGYNLALGDSFSTKIQGAVMIDRTWDTPSTEQNNGNFSWSLFLDPKLLDVFDAELFIKGKRVGEAGSDKVSEFVTGAYFKPTFIPLLADSAFGGSAVILDGKLQEWNADWRAFVKLSGDLWITYYGKFAKLVSKDGDTPYEPVDGASVGALAGLTAFKSSQALWNMISVRYKINDRFTGILSVGELSDLDDGFHLGRESADGTQVFAHPHVQIYAAKNATVTAGVLAAFAGIGADEMANKDIDMIINIPVLFRVKM